MGLEEGGESYSLGATGGITPGGIITEDYHFRESITL